LSAFDRSGPKALKPPEVVVEKLYRKAAVERAMKVQEVIMKAMAKQITWWQAAEILGVTTRTIRRLRRRWEREGFEG
jgi:transcriptional regulator with GAF, ATPase, and Fis domain